MSLPYFQVDAFTSRVFGGNPAGVCPLDAWLPEVALQAIAAENNLSETAFIVGREGGYELRWFTPTVEVDLCGHATLAAAFVIFTELGFAGEAVQFQTKSGAGGELFCEDRGGRVGIGGRAALYSRAQLEIA